MYPYHNVDKTYFFRSSVERQVGAAEQISFFMDNGWIKIHRKMLGNPILKNYAYRAVWIQLLLMATHDGYDVMFKGKRIKLRAGQLTAGTHQLSEETEVPRGTVVRIMKCFENEHMIEQQKSNKCTLITIVKWSYYQSREQQNEHQMDIKRTTDGHQMDTNQEGKKEKNERMEETLAASKDAAEVVKPQSDINQILEMFQMNLNEATNYGNKQQRKAVQELITLLGKEKLIRTIEYVISVKNEEFAPTITTPYQLQAKLGQITAYFKKHTASKNTIAVIS
jgi:hypothetical protein